MLHCSHGMIDVCQRVIITGTFFTLPLRVGQYLELTDPGVPKIKKKKSKKIGIPDFPTLSKAKSLTIINQLARKTQPANYHYHFSPLLLQIIDPQPCDGDLAVGIQLDTAHYLFINPNQQADCLKIEAPCPQRRKRKRERR